MDWSDIKLTGNPQLVVGLRDKRRRMTGYLVDIDRDVHKDLREVATSSAERIAEMRPVAYTPYVDPEEDEYLTVDVSALLTRAQSRRAVAEPPTESDEHAAIVAMIAGSDYLERLGARQLLERADNEFYVQAICLKNAGARIGFVTRANPRQVLKHKRIWLGRHDQEDRLQRISPPELTLETNVDAIVTPDEIAIINRNSFQHIVSDSQLIASFVPAQVNMIGQRLSSRGLPVSIGTLMALMAAAGKSPRLAKRLSIFAERIALIDVATVSSGSGFVASDLDKADFVNGQGELECDPGRVGELLDALEGRLFSDPFSPEKRRADRFRRR
jgi:hypothetical protein